MFWVRRLLVLVLVGCVSLQLNSINQLKKVFFHQGIFGDKLVFYCSSCPVLKSGTEKNGKKMSFACELFHINSQEECCQERIEYINKIQKKKAKSKNVPYTISIVPEEKIFSLKVSIVYDPQEVDIVFRQCKAITGCPAVILFISYKKSLKKYAERKMGSRWTCLNDIQKSRKIRVVVDAGHGGVDGGAHGKLGIVEKDITLKVSKLLAQELKNHGFEVKLTRSSDVFVPLEERTGLTNLIVNADIFISLHCNASTRQEVSGLETYYLSSVKGKSTYEEFISLFSEHSKHLAQNVQESIIREMKEEGKIIKDRGTKEAVTQVLLGTEAPAILVEMDFVTNEQAARCLLDDGYQKSLAQAIALGVASYAEKN